MRYAKCYIGIPFASECWHQQTKNENQPVFMKVKRRGYCCEHAHAVKEQMAKKVPLQVVSANPAKFDSQAGMQQLAK